jgi:Ca2+-binding RTX toxin-like protein
MSVITDSNVTFKFSSSGDTLTIEAGGLLYPSAPLYGEGVFCPSTLSKDSLINEGNILSIYDAVDFFSNGGSITNAASGSIYGLDGGIFAGNIDSIVNHGVILSTEANSAVTISAQTPGFHTVVTNDGEIYGRGSGIFALSNYDGGIIDNIGAGVIRSAEDGIQVLTNFGLTTSIYNGLHATIDGAMHSIDAGTTISLTNFGEMIGDVRCYSTLATNDIIINHGMIDGQVFLGRGSEFFNGRRGISGDIHAGGDNDRIIVGKGNVSVFIPGGNDVLTAGPGHDRFIFQFALPVIPVEKITNFSVSRDKIVMSQADFAGIGPVGHALAAADFHIGPHAKTASQHIIYNASTGFLFYDPDGRGPEPQVHFATVGPDLTPTHDDFLVTA